MARPQKFRHSREALNDPQIAEKLGHLVVDIETLRIKRKQIDDQIAAAYDTVDDAGFEKKFVRRVVSLRAKETDARRDEEEGLEAYEIAVEKGVSLASARKERNLPPHNPVTGELADEAEPADAAVTVGNDLREPVAAEQGQIIREGDAPRETDCQAGEQSQGGSDASCPDAEFSSVQSETTVVSAYAGTASEENPAPIEESEPAHAVRSEARDSVAGTVLSEGCEPAERSSDESSAPHSDALVAQRIEQEASNLSVAGSNPAECSTHNPVPHTPQVDGGQPHPSSDEGGDEPGITSGKSGHQHASAAQAGDPVGSASGASATNSDDLEIPAFLKRTDGYAAASGRGA